ARTGLRLGGMITRWLAGARAAEACGRTLGLSPTKAALVIPKVITSPSLICSRSTSRSLTNVPLVDPRSIRKYCPSSHQIFACLEETPASAMRMLHAEARPTVIASGVSSISWLSRDPLRIRSNAIWTADVSQGARLASKGQGANLDPRPRRTLRFTPFPTRVSSMPEAAASSDVGTSFGKFFLLKKLAAGGMGEVFLARQQGPAGFQKVLVVK